MTNYQIAHQLFDDDTYREIVRYMDERIPFYSVGLDTEQFVRRYRHNDSFFVAIHQQLGEFASDLFGEKLKPSYVFLSMYENDGICPLHIDRPQCYRTIDYLIRQDDPDPWPIHIGGLHTDEEIAALYEAGEGHPEGSAIDERIWAETWETALINPNDAVCYSGTHQWHYRSQRLKGRADLAFFHFVPEDFDGPLA